VTTPYDVVLKHAETIPDQTALMFSDARWSYADLAEQAGRVAGVQPCLLNNRLTAPELAPLLARLRPRALLADRERLPLAIESCELANLTPTLVLIDDADEHQGIARWADLLASTLYSGPAPRAGEVFEITFTSGTTSAVTRPDLGGQQVAELRGRHPGAVLAGSPTDGTRIRIATADGADAPPGSPGS
jgi:acyl-CoA synthetase (AMP-forming)/AMP-acid ligase II